QKIGHRGHVDVSRHAGVPQERFDLGGKDNPTGYAAEIQRTHTKEVSAEHELLRPLIPNRQGELAVRFPPSCWSLTLVQMQQNLAGMRSGELVPFDAKLRLQIIAVDHVPVADHQQRSVLVRDNARARFARAGPQKAESEKRCSATVDVDG